MNINFKSFLIFVFGLMFFFVPTLVLAQESRVDRVLIIDPKEDEHYYLGLSENIEARGEVNGDLFVVGKSVKVTGNINGDLVVLAGELKLEGNVERNLIVAGGDVEVNGNVGRNILVLAGGINIMPDAVVSGGIVGAAANSVLAGPIAGKVSMIAQAIKFTNNVGDSVEIFSEDVSVEDSASIAGKLKVHSNKEINIEGATVSGGIEKLSAPQMSMDKQDMERGQTAGLIFSFLSKLLVGLIAIRLLGKHFLRMQEVVRLEPWWTTLKGLLLLFFTPLIVVLVSVTIVGLPLGLILLTFYVLGIYLAFITVSLFIGKAMKIPNNNLAFVVGLLVLTFANLFHFLNVIVGLWVVALGLGSVWVYFKGNQNKKSS